MKSDRLPSLKALRTFEVLSRHLHMNRAAEELSVTPSAISHLIRSLEEELSVKLIRKSGRNIALTETGEQLAPRVQTIFRSLKHTVDDVREQTNPNILNVSLRPYFAVKWLSPRLSRFWARHPEIELRLIHTNLAVNFNNDRADLAIEWSSGDRMGTKQILLIPGELTPVFSPQMVGADKIKTARDLLNHTLLRETDHDSWKDWFESVGENYQKPPHTLFIDDSNVRYQSALDGQGIELSCRSLITDDVKSGKLLSPFKQSVNNFSYYLVEPDDRKPSDATGKFTDWLIDEVNSQQSY